MRVCCGSAYGRGSFVPQHPRRGRLRANAEQAKLALERDDRTARGAGSTFGKAAFPTLTKGACRPGQSENPVSGWMCQRRIAAPIYASRWRRQILTAANPFSQACRTAPSWQQVAVQEHVRPDGGGCGLRLALARRLGHAALSFRPASTMAGVEPIRSAPLQSQPAGIMGRTQLRSHHWLWSRRAHKTISRVKKFQVHADHHG